MPSVCGVLLTLTLTLTLALTFMVPPSACQTQVHMHMEMYDSVVDLHCDVNSTTDLQNHTGVYHYQWILPSGEILNSQPPSPMPALAWNATQRLTLADNGARLRINKLGKPDFGLYVCLVFNTSGQSDSFGLRYVIRHGVNLDGAYFGDQFAKYEPQMKTGLIAGGAVLVIMTLICCNLEQVSMRYERKQKRREKEKVNRNRTSHNAMQSIQSIKSREMQYFNNGMIFDEDDGEVVDVHQIQFDGEMKENPPTKL